MTRGFNIETTTGQIILCVEKLSDSVYGELFVGADGVHYKRSHGLKFELCERQPEGVTAAQEAFVAAAAASKVDEGGTQLVPDESLTREELGEPVVADLSEDELADIFTDVEPDADVVPEDDTL